MDLLKYEVFLKVVDRGGFSSSAEDLGYTRSGLSKLLKSMEQEIGFSLVIRTSRGIELNEEGKKVVSLIRELVKVNTVLEEEYAAMRGMTCGKIRIGCFPTMAYLLMPDILSGFHEEHPGIEIEIEEENSLPQLESWLKQGIIDVGFFSQEPHHAFDWIGAMAEPYVALLPNEHILAEKEVVSVEEMFDYDLILFKTHEGYDQDMVKFESITDKKKEPKYHTNSINFAQEMVVNNGCISIVPLSVAKKCNEMFSVEYRKLDTEVTRNLGFAVKHKANVSLTLREFLRYVKKYIKDWEY